MRTIAIPFHIDPAGRVGYATGEYAVAAQYLKTLLMTSIGERPMRSLYGTTISDAVFEPLDSGLIAEIEADIRDAVRRWEPDISIISAEARVVGESKLEFEVLFGLRSTLDDRPGMVSVIVDVGGRVEEQA